MPQRKIIYRDSVGSSPSESTYLEEPRYFRDLSGMCVLGVLKESLTKVLQKQGSCKS